MPTHHNLDRYLEYIAAAGLAGDRKGPLFRTMRGRSGELTESALLQPDVWRMIRRRALAAGIKTEAGCRANRLCSYLWGCSSLATCSAPLRPTTPYLVDG